MKDQTPVEYMLHSPLSPLELIEHIKENSYACYISASFGAMKHGYTFVVRSENDSEIVLEPVGFFRNSERPNLLLKLHRKEIGEGTDIEVVVLRRKMIWPFLIICLAGLVLGAMFHFLVILLIPFGLLVLIVCRKVAECEIPQLKDSLVSLLEAELR